MAEKMKLLLVMLSMVFVNVHSARDDRIVDIKRILERIEEQITKEDRLRAITDIFRMDSNIDKLNKKMDKIVDLLEGNSNLALPRSSGFTSVAESSPSTLDEITQRLDGLEKSMEKLDVMLVASDLPKLKDINERSVQMKDDVNQKLRKVMNVISALYDMNKDMKTNMGARSDSGSDTPSGKPTTNFAAEFLVENLEELERKIKEQFSVLANEIRSEITGLKIVASSVSGGCNSPASSDFDYDYPTPSSPSSDSKTGRSNSRRAPRRGGAERRDEDGNALSGTLNDLVQSLGRTTREIKEELHQGIQTLDMKLTNLSILPLRCGEDQLEASASVLQPIRSGRDYVQHPDQMLEENEDRKKEACSRIANTLITPRSCAELRRGGVTCDGTYVVFPQNVRAVRVLCDMNTEGGGWTVLMRRGDYGDKMTSFHRNWLSYKNGFGDMDGEFWLGNDVQHLLTNQEDNMLRVRLESFDDESVNLTYSLFKVSGETDFYRMHLGPAVGPPVSATNSLKYHNNHPFSTFDKKNDSFKQNCAATYKGGWWFNGCYFGFLTGEYFKPDEKREDWQGILWYDWKGNAALKGGSMLVRPKNFTSY